MEALHSNEHSEPSAALTTRKPAAGWESLGRLVWADLAAEDSESLPDSACGFHEPAARPALLRLPPRAFPPNRRGARGGRAKADGDWRADAAIALPSSHPVDVQSVAKFPEEPTSLYRTPPPLSARPDGMTVDTDPLCRHGSAAFFELDPTSVNSAACPVSGRGKLKESDVPQPDPKPYRIEQCVLGIQPTIEHCVFVNPPTSSATWEQKVSGKGNFKESEVPRPNLKP